MCGNSQCGQLFHGSVVHRRMRTNTLYGLEAFRIRVRKSAFSGSDGQSKRLNSCKTSYMSVSLCGHVYRH